jgi:NADH dehydrogenase
MTETGTELERHAPRHDGPPPLTEPKAEEAMGREPPHSQLVITGATGYVGTALLAYSRRAGLTPIAATRKPPPGGAIWLPYDLSDTHSFDVPPGTLAIVHLAATTDGTRVEPERDVAAARRLLAACHRAKARLVFVSSQTARPDAPTAYGRSKWQVEQEVLKAGHVVVRPGLVYGGPARGVFGKLVGLVQRWPLLPAFLPAPVVHPVHVDDLAAVLVAAATSPTISTEPLEVGTMSPIPFTSFLHALACWHLQRRRLFVPVPSRPLRWLLRRLPPTWRGGLRLEQLASLLELPSRAAEPAVEGLGVTLRRWPSGLTPSSRSGRRALVLECRTLLTYVLKAPPPPHLHRRLVRCIVQVRQGTSLDLPPLVHQLPLLLGSLELPVPWRSPQAGELAWRIQAASLLAESTPACTARFLAGPAGQPRWRAAFGLAGTMLKAALLALVSLGLGPALRLAWRPRG